MRMLLGLTDRVLFACGFILGLQIPQFVDQYTHQYEGYHTAVADTLAKYQENADQNYAGQLDALVDALRDSPQTGLAAMGQQIIDTREREQRMRRTLFQLRNGSLPERLWHLVENLDSKIAANTVHAFTPGLPLSTQALICGLIIAVALNLLFQTLRGFAGLFVRRGPRLPRIDPPLTKTTRRWPKIKKAEKPIVRKEPPPRVEPQLQSASHRRS